MEIEHPLTLLEAPCPARSCPRAPNLGWWASMASLANSVILGPHFLGDEGPALSLPKGHLQLDGAEAQPACCIGPSLRQDDKPSLPTGCKL